ncbi:MAG: hypothetical protein HZB79_07400 [Deltaproteobacteria bacterium]|nr:hypothetical protein [Deltaproteobacteria bacterium]
MRNVSRFGIHCKRWGISFFIISILFLGIENAAGQGISIFTASKAEIERYFRYKYGFQRGMRVSLRSDPPLCGTIYELSIEDDIGGKGGIRPPHLGPNVKDRQAIILAFFKEEAEFFGLTSMSEMRFGSRKQRKDLREKEMGKYEAVERVRGGLYHYIGGIPLECTGTLVHLNPDGSIKSLMADVVPVTPELLRALTQPTLSEADIRRIVEEDLLPDEQSSPMTRDIKRGKRPDIHPKTMEVEKAAIPVPPYIVYKAFSAWDYTIDAFTGRILQKIQSWRD